MLFPSEESRNLRSKGLKKKKKKKKRKKERKNFCLFLSNKNNYKSGNAARGNKKRNLKSDKRKASWLGNLGPEEQSSRVS